MAGTPTDRMRSVADRIGIDADAETVGECVDSLENLEDAAQRLESDVSDGGSGETVPASGSIDDPLDAFLATYETPRSEGGGPLEGLSLAIKDNIAVRGLAMTCGSAEFDVVPSFDGAVVERLLDAGGAVVGKTNMDVFGFGPSGEFSDFAQVENPVDPDRVPGGSSSGSGAAVASGAVDAALGTDTGGSVRMPAACCGIAGVKPTHGLVPRYGFVDMAPSLDTIGPLAREVETAARVLSAIAGFDRRDPSSRRTDPGDLTDVEPGDLDIGVPPALVDPADAPVRGAIESLVDALDARDGVTAETAPLGSGFERGRIEDAYFLTAMTEFAWLLRQSGAVRGQGTGYSGVREAVASMVAGGVDNDQVAWRVLPSACLDTDDRGAAYAAARQATVAFQRRLDEYFDRYDLLLCPTIRTLPPEYGQMDTVEAVVGLNGNCLPFNLSGNPAATVPFETADGLPISAQLVAPEFRDARAARGARLVEQTAEYELESVLEG